MYSHWVLLTPSGMSQSGGEEELKLMPAVPEKG
jgi:hypothetical protein